ncbi:hypothetical protein B0I32_14414 [Nonomuraea fuscirosea]|uniref:Uncharacterized protein n=1 Tax=Nonomuraea fuscirosea TaxID=1291556 RepID=A0A2T0LT01_9ACTN|nr:hypothetical protein B0I32_14414 [Nonomuraea fuscirosea]
MNVFLRRQPRSEIKELPHTRLDESAYGPTQKGPIGPGILARIRHGLENGLSGFAIGSEVILTTQQIVVDACRARHARVNAR